MSLPINHLKRTLDRCCGQWEFVDFTSRSFAVRFLNTQRRFICACVTLYDNKWEAWEVVDENEKEIPDQRLTGILNGHTRSESGEVALSFQVGDVVRCIKADPLGLLTVGTLYEVCGVQDSRIHIGNDRIWFLAAEYFMSSDSCLHETPDKVVL